MEFYHDEYMDEEDDSTGRHVIPTCDRCGDKYRCAAPDYGDGYGGAVFRHVCGGREYSAMVDGYTKADSYRDAGKP